MKAWIRKPQGIVLAALLGLALVAGGVAGILALTDPYDCCMAPGVTLGGLELGGLTRGQAKKALTQALEETVYAQELTVLLPEECLTLSPEELGLKGQVSAAIRDAYRLGRKTEGRELGLRPYLTVDEDAIRACLTDYAQAHDTTLTQPGYTLTGDDPNLSTENSLETIACQTLTLTLGTPESHLDVEEALERVLNAYDSGISACRAGNFQLTLETEATAQPESLDLDAIWQEVSRQPVDDGLDMQTFGFTHGSYGYSFDKLEAQTLLEKEKPGATVTVPMTCTPPEILGDGVYFRDVLGSCQTKHNTNENRNTNLRVMSQALDGFVLQPGEEFSFNQVVGERTKERGYLPAPAYSGNRLTDAVGGGVCQGSSTLYNCVLLADLEVTDRSCHGAPINYLPLGLDAAVNWLTTDFCFRNNWNFPIKIQARVTDEYLEMEILGTDEKDYTIEMKAFSWREGDTTWASSHKLKYDKETGELLSDDRLAYSTYYHFD